MHWAHPEAFLLLLLLPLAFWPLRGRSRIANALPSTDGPWRCPSVAARIGPLVLTTLRALSLVILITAVARPQTPDPQAKSHTEGIAIQLVLDTSISMGYTDYSLNGQTISRMDAARHAIRLFVAGSPEHNLPGRRDDLLGLVTFNRYPDVACPLTHSHDALLVSLDELSLGPYTNIGDGLAWGLDRLRRAKPKQKILILLSDGKHNAPESMDPDAAGRLAADLGVRIYTIGAVGNRARSLSPGEVDWATANSIDEFMLKRIASITGGKYFRATDTDGLLAIYREIDQLEKSKIDRPAVVRYHEWFPGCLIAGLVVLALEQLLAATRFLVVG